MLQRLVISVFRRLPVPVRRVVVRLFHPSFTVGAMCFVERSDGALLLVRHTYRKRWGVPGGLLERGEAAADGAVREAMEEVGIAIDLVGEPTVVVDPDPRRVDVIFRARPAAGVDPGEAVASSPEIAEVRWFPSNALPELQFETAGALVALGRAAFPPVQRPLPDPVWPDLGAGGL